MESFGLVLPMGSISSAAATLYGGSGCNIAEGKFVQQTVGLSGSIGGGTIGMLAFSSLSGGAGSALTGGNFYLIVLYL